MHILSQLVSSSGYLSAWEEVAAPRNQGDDATLSVVQLQL
jgi:hypothetical protein